MFHLPKREPVVDLIGVPPSLTAPRGAGDRLLSRLSRLRVAAAIRRRPDAGDEMLEAARLLEADARYYRR